MFDNLNADIKRTLGAWKMEHTFLNVVRLLFKSPPVWAIIDHRFNYWAKKHLFPIPLIGTLFFIPYRYILTNLVYAYTGIEIGMAKIGKGFVIMHGHGTVISGSAEIGENCTINHQVTMGGGKGGCPKIGNRVVIFAGAVIIGGIKVGDRAIIGANAVVTHDVPPNTVVAGVPAKVLHKRRKNQ
jgi:serine O-acetyltransferase